MHYRRVHLLVTKHVGTHSTSDESTYGAQRSSAHLVTKECTTSTSYECRAEATLAVCRTTRSARLTVLT